MALRVLLADESSTIRKVMQLSLQDLGVEVRSVNIGTDVLQAAESFKPEIIFVDILLQKRNGYDVCQDVKTHPQLKSVPCVLMWSGFMNLDDKRIKQIGIDEMLEKPFDTEKIREIVKKLVPTTESNVIGHFLEFPPLPKEGEKVAEDIEPINTSNSLNVQPKNNWNMESFDSIQNFDQLPDLSLQTKPVEPVLAPIVENDDKEDFVNVSLTPQAHENLMPAAVESEEGNWVQKNIGQFHLELPPEAALDEVTVDYKVNEDKFENTNFLLNYADLQKMQEAQDISKKSAIIMPQPATEKFEESDVDDPSLAASVITMEQLQPVASFSSKTSLTNEIVLKPEPTAPVSNSAITNPNYQISEPTNLSEEQLEDALRNQSREVIERIVMKIVPEIATELIQKEIARLLSEPKS